MFTTARTPLFLALAVFGTACMPKTNMRVLQPASVDVPADIQVVGVIDRSSARNAGETLLGVLEGALTGETLGADTQGRREAIEAAVRILEESPRFEVVRISGRRGNGSSSLFDRELDRREVERLCREAGCDALLALEAFDSDTRMQVNGVTVSALTNPDRLKRQIADLDVDDVRATADTRVMTSWRMYDADDARIVDELRDRERTWNWQGSGALVDVRRQMPLAADRIGRVGSQAGADYAARIAPSWQWVERRYYGSGDPKLREAKRYVKAGDWAGAMRIWETLENHPKPRVRGKASFNLALAHEVRGDFGEALDHARAAAVAMSNGKTRRYVFTLEQRQRDEARLASQMAAPAEHSANPPARSPDRTGSPVTQTGPRRPSTTTGTPGAMTRPR